MEILLVSTSNSTAKSQEKNDQTMKGMVLGTHGKQVIALRVDETMNIDVPIITTASLIGSTFARTEVTANTNEMTDLMAGKSIDHTGVF
nr:hypothetical protein [Tanacetum cinerariifolium]